MTLPIYVEAELRVMLPPPDQRRAIRVAAGVAQAAVADELKVTRQAISLWETGRRSPDSEHLESYAALLARLLEIVWGKV